MEQHKKSNGKVFFLVQAGAIAALYVVLTVFVSAFNLASGAIQVRLSEALCILPCFTLSAVPGLAIGCFLANLFTGAAVWDVIFGTLATLIGGIFTYLLRKHKFLSTLPPVIANAVIIPFVLCYAYGLNGVWVVNGVDLSLLFYAFTVGLGEVISVCIFGSILRKALETHAPHLFK